MSLICGVGQLDPHCDSCGEGAPTNECRKSKRPCGHHCNHSWSHDGCDWCGTLFGEGGIPVELGGGTQ
jgi:hypothetical protein